MNTAAAIGLQLGATGLAALCVWGVTEIYALRGHARGSLSQRSGWRLIDSAMLTGLAGLALTFVAFALAQFAHYS